LGGKWGYFVALDMPSKGLGEIFEVDVADMCAKKGFLVSMAGQVDPQSMCRWGARNPLGESSNYVK
jgi:hypothetical protein